VRRKTGYTQNVSIPRLRREEPPAQRWLLHGAVLRVFMDLIPQKQAPFKRSLIMNCEPHASVWNG
jgi:hypothetical protein